MKRKAILILGPTGSGKTPLGEMLEAKGIGGFRLAHLDFGQCLRDVTAGKNTYGMSVPDIDFLVEVLESGALLENETFHLAQKVIDGFCTNNAADADFIVLNGLPRHLGQAADVDNYFEVVKVVHLVCTPLTVRDRIFSNSGGDRSLRVDDTLDLIEKKLEIFHQRTLPLLEFYQKKGTPLSQLEVRSSTEIESLVNLLEQDGLFSAR